MMEPEQQKEHPKDDVEEMDTEHGGDTAPTADSDESKITIWCQHQYYVETYAEV
ncbi:hypothetical protein DY000_02004263 [Brassica cretica]|uniref:Uncharacterized protein n=1 Tax=Brassica cretica TaxID=69181 RepID=A0ABQ7BTQ3_BRACR|nr:hypothetical protein DY000_02004263 [Brassica cretica]